MLGARAKLMDCLGCLAVPVQQEPNGQTLLKCRAERLNSRTGTDRQAGRQQKGDDHEEGDDDDGDDDDDW